MADEAHTASMPMHMADDPDCDRTSRAEMLARSIAAAAAGGEMGGGGSTGEARVATVIDSCPSWMVYSGWAGTDIGARRTAADVQQKAVIKTPEALTAFAAFFHCDSPDHSHLHSHDVHTAHGMFRGDEMAAPHAGYGGAAAGVEIVNGRRQLSGQALIDALERKGRGVV